LIEDLDGVSPRSRHGHVRIVSALLVVAAFAGWAAASDPALQGPFATPRPSLLVKTARFTPEPFTFIEPASAHASSAGCIVPGSVSTVTVLVGERPVTYTRPVATSAISSCVGVFFQRSNPVPLERLAR
jgi:hypothetical protein